MSGATITREFGFDMGHCLPDHQGGCYRPHGHRYRLEITLAGDVQTAGAANGMVMDFGDLKAIVTREVVDRLDHRFLMSRQDPRADAVSRSFGGITGGVTLIDRPPTAENLAEMIGTWLTAAGLDVDRVTLWETPTCRAEWTPSAIAWPA